MHQHSKPAFRAILVFGILVFLPLKMFTFKLGLNLGFSRILLIFGVVLVLGVAILSYRRSQDYFLPQAYFSNYMSLLLCFAGFSYLFSCLTYSGDQESSRVFIMGARFFESVLFVPLVFFLLIKDNVERIQIFTKVVWWWKFAILIAIPQFALSLIGLTIIYETIGEAAPENIASVGGHIVVRVNSFFGEPRDLAALLIPIMMFYCVIKDRALSVFEKCLIASVGVMTFSNTFVISMCICLFLRPFTGGSLGQIFVKVFALLIIFLGLALVLVFSQDLIFSVVPRLQIILDTLKLVLITGDSGNIGEDVAQQISDVLVLPYIFSGYFIGVEGLLGHGLGSSQLILRSLAGEFFGFSDPDILFGTRFVFFLLVLDLGLVGCILFMKIILDLVSHASAQSNSPNTFRYYSYCIIFVALLNDSYFFICYLMYLSTLKGLTNNDLSPKNSSISW